MVALILKSYLKSSQRDVKAMRKKGVWNHMSLTIFQAGQLKFMRKWSRVDNERDTGR